MSRLAAQLRQQGIVPTELSLELTRYALSLPGVRQCEGACYTDPDLVLICPQLIVPGPTWGEFFEVLYPAASRGAAATFTRSPKIASSKDDRDSPFTGPWAHLYVRKGAMQVHQRAYPMIESTTYQQRDGHVSMLIPLDGRVPIDVLKGFVDDAYELACRKLKPVERLMLRFSEQAMSDEALLQGLI